MTRINSAQRSLAVASTETSVAKSTAKAKDVDTFGQARPGTQVPQPSTDTKKNIGWLWRDTDAKPGPDITEAFLTRYIRASGGQDVLPPEAKSYVYLWLPGLINKHVQGDLYESTQGLKDAGLEVRDLPLSGQTSLADNAELVAKAIAEVAAEGKQAVLVGYSWGANAGLDALALHPELAQHVAAVTTQEAPYAGNAVINEIMSSAVKTPIAAAFHSLTDVTPQALADMAYPARQKFIAEHPYPKQVPTVSFVGDASSSRSLLAPSATYLRDVLGTKSDGMVATADASPPGAATVRMRGVDHMGAVSSKPGLASSVSPAVTTLALVSLALERARAAKSNSSILDVTADEMRAYDLENKASDKYPTLSRALSDPDAFTADVKGRFAKQKALTPSDPYAFDFSDYAAPVLDQMRKAITTEVGQIKGKDAEHQVGREYLLNLEAEISGAIKSGPISYRRMIELGYFASRAVGHFDMAQLKARDRVLLNLDRYQLGYLRTDIREEFRRYHSGDFKVFNKSSPVASLKQVEGDFASSVFDPAEMRMICLPTMECLETVPLMRLLALDIYLLGVGADPIAADGFVRPGGDFWNHDMRHSASIFVKKRAYQKQHDLSDRQMNKLQKKSDLWSRELDARIDGLADPNLKEAVKFLMFNYHHDRGVPKLPSSYGPRQKPGTVALLLYTMLTVSSQPVNFHKPVQSLAQAWDWLQDQWLPHLREEKAIWKAER